MDHKLTEIGRSLVAGEKSGTQFQQTQKEEGVHYTPVPAMPDQESADVSELSDREICCQRSLLPFLGGEIHNKMVIQASHNKKW